MSDETTLCSSAAPATPCIRLCKAIRTLSDTVQHTSNLFCRTWRRRALMQLYLLSLAVHAACLVSLVYIQNASECLIH